MTYQTIQTGIDGPVATITLNRPDKLNAISGLMLDEIDDALAGYRSGYAVRVIRLKASGRVFCAGYDLASDASVYNAGLPEAGEPDPDAPLGEVGESSIVLDRERLSANIERLLRIRDYRKPIVAQVHAPCLSGGLDLIGMCDIVYAGTSARFGHPAARGMGIPPTMGLLPSRIGAARTKELFFTGDTVDGEQAQRLGMVNAVVADADLDGVTATLCRRIGANSMDALALHKSVINRWDDIAGLRTAVAEGAEFDAMFHATQACAHFGRLAARDGVRAALEWRDRQF